MEAGQVKALNDREYFCVVLGADELIRTRWDADKFILFSVESGTVSVVVEGETRVLDRNRLLMLRPQVDWSVAKVSSDLCVTLIGFPHTMLHERTARMEPLFFFHLYTRMVWVLDRKRRRLLDHFKGLFRFAADNIGRGYDRDFTVALVTGFVYGSYQAYGELPAAEYPDSSRGRELFRKFMRLVHVSYKVSHEVQYYAERLCISPKYLTQITKHTIGQTPKQILDAELTREATKLLEKNDCSIAEISSRLGFSDQSHFCRFFRRMTKTSPQQFRLKPVEIR